MTPTSPHPPDRRRRGLARLALAAFLLGCAPEPSASSVAGLLPTSPVVLDAGRPGLDRIGGLRFLGGLEVSDRAAAVGGLSAMELLDGGRRLVALSDRGGVFRAEIAYRDGRPVGLRDLAVQRIADLGGRWKYGDKDAESLARLPDGSWLVGFEQRHRIWRYPADPAGPLGAPADFPTPPDLSATADDNAGLEALAVLGDGRVFAVEEGPSDDAPRRAWIGGDAGWEPLSYLAAPGFRPTGATTLPSGDVLVLERRFSFFRGFAARIARVPAGAIRPGAVVEGEEVAVLAPPLAVDNFEAISAEPLPDGRVLLALLSDDNFLFLQRTLLLFFEIDDEGARAAS